jgi:iron(III) transport system substrate-binding protein
VRSSSRRDITLILTAAIAVAACGGGIAPTDAPSTPPPTSVPTTAAPTPEPTVGGTLVVYSGRSQTLIEPLIERFRAATGVDVRVEYGDTAELAATILEEGDRSPADVYFAQDGGALGALAGAGRLAPLPRSTLDLVDPRFRSPDGVWVGVSGRARVVAYDTRVLAEADLPPSILGYTDPDWSGRIGWAPTNGSFQAFITAFRVLQGDAAAKAWLEGIQANRPKVYDSNGAVLAAIAAGEVEVGFINHYYLMRQLAEQGEGYPVRNQFLTGGDVGALVNVAGVGILTTAANPAAAQAFVDFLVTDQSQRYFAEQTYEYPLVPGIPADPRLPALADIQAPEIDLSDLADLAATLRLIQEAGVL